MQWLRVSKLNSGIGKKCLIIGGGESAGRFDYNKLPKGFVLIGINESGIMTGHKTDYLIYADGTFVRNVLSTLRVPYETAIVCPSEKPSPLARYCYSHPDIHPCLSEYNTGLKALIIAKTLFKFDEIYLVGFDYYCKEGQSHFYGDNVGSGQKYSEPSNLEGHYKQLNYMPDQFNIVSHYDNVYNCNESSNLRLFKFKKPYKE